MFFHCFVCDICFFIILVCKNTFFVATGALACLFFCPAYYYSMAAQSIIDCVPSFMGIVKSYAGHVVPYMYIHIV